MGGWVGLNKFSNLWLKNLSRVKYGKQIPKNKTNCLSMHLIFYETDLLKVTEF